MEKVLHHFVRVDFFRFKAFKQFSLSLKQFNILVGPNNAGKSTILSAFRMLSAGLRKANSKKPEYILGPDGMAMGYKIDLSSVSVAEENIFYNYEDSVCAYVRFILSNKNKLTLFFPERGVCNMFADANGFVPRRASDFKKFYNCPIGFVPILGPVEHNEPLYQEEAARLALYNYTAARNFRNIWYYYPEKFDDFRRILSETWPGMDVEAPILEHTDKRSFLYMFCPEERIPREIFWAGFGFQVWCQMLTHLIQSSEASLFLIDEPDIYLHADLQRQLLDLLRNLGPDILLATHSTEIISEAESNDLVVINKKYKSGRRIKHPNELFELFSKLGSSLNPILTQLAKTRKVLFVEGKDYQIIGRFARKIDYLNLAVSSEFAVITVEGFNPDRIRNIKKGIEITLDGRVVCAAILDRDYRSNEECDYIEENCKGFCEFIKIHKCKELENFLLLPRAIDAAAEKRVLDNYKRNGKKYEFKPFALDVLNAFANKKKSYVMSQQLSTYKMFMRSNSSQIHESTMNEKVLSEFEASWIDFDYRMNIIPGKDALHEINAYLQEKYKVSVTTAAIIDAMTNDEVPVEMKQLLKSLYEFVGTKNVL